MNHDISFKYLSVPVNTIFLKTSSCVITTTPDYPEGRISDFVTTYDLRLHSIDYAMMTCDIIALLYVDNAQ